MNLLVVAFVIGTSDDQEDREANAQAIRALGEQSDAC